MTCTSVEVKRQAGTFSCFLLESVTFSDRFSLMYVFRQIEWVVEQILKNALEVSSKGNTIHFRSHRSGDTCTIEVEDEGPGFRMENLKNIFRPFFTTKKEGYGLALAACRKVLQDMGGDVNVKSASGKGALFTLIVPREYSGKPLSMDPIETVVQGEKVEGLYRE